MAPMQPSSSSRKRRRWILPVLIAAGLAVLLLNPFSLLLGAYYVAGPVAYYVVPACRTREYASGDHLGFRVGMAQEEALATIQRRYAGQRFPIVFLKDPGPPPDPDAPIDYGAPPNTAQNAAELAAKAGPDQSWSFGYGGTHTCVISLRTTRLDFLHGRVAKIADEVNVDWI